MSATPAWIRPLALGGLSVLTLAGVSTVGIVSPAGATSTFAVKTLAGSDRFATAAAIATAAYPKGAATVILASGLSASISDSLSASYLAGQLNGGAGAPILLTSPNSLPASTTSALATLGAKNVIIVGGTSAVTDAVAATLTADGYSVTRVAGADRFATSALLDSVSGDTSVGTAAGTAAAGPSVATSNGVTLASSSVAQGGTVSGTLANPASVKTLTVSGAGLSGQTLVVSPSSGAFSFSVSAKLSSGAYTIVFSTTPVNGGPVTQGTTVLTVNLANGSTVAGQRFAIVADGQDANLADSLGAAPIAFAEHFPLLLVNGSTGTLSAAELALLKSDNIQDVLLVGGTAAIGAQVATEVSGNSQTPVAVAGSDLSTTSEALADYAVDNFGFSTTTFDVASGTQADWVDSLSGGPYGGAQVPPAPTLITATSDLADAAATFAAEHAGTETSAAVFGGSGAVDANVITAVMAAGTTTPPVTEGSVTVIPTSTAAAGTFSGLVNTPSLVKSVTVSGCGLASSPVVFSATGTFAITIPATQPAGACTLTFTATLSSGGTVTSTASVVAPSASASTSGLDPVLVSAHITQDNFLADTPSTVQFVFSVPVTPSTLADFELEGYASTRAAATAVSALQDGTNSDAIDVEFAPSVDVASYTTAAVTVVGATTAAVGQSGASAGQGSTAGSVSLGGSSGPTSTTVGPTIAPDLVAAQVVSGDPDEVTYTFDKPVTAVTDLAGFGPMTPTGDVIGTDSVTVTFGASQSNTTTFTVLNGTVTGTAGVPNPTGSVGGSGGLVSVTPVSGDPLNYDFTFANTVASATAGDFQLFTNNGTLFAAGETTDIINNDTVLVDFAGAGLTSSTAATVTLGAVAPAGAVSYSGIGTSSGIGALPITG